MTARGSRNHKRKMKRARAAVRALRLEDLPRPLRLVAEAEARLSSYVRSSHDNHSALARAEEQLEAGLQELVSVLRQFYPMDVAELVAMLNLTGNPETYQETEHEGSVAVVEVVTLAAATMPAPSSPIGPARYIPTGAIDAVQATATRVVEAASLKALFRAADDPSNPLGPLGFASVIREITLRNTTYPHMLRDTLLELYGGEVESDLLAATGLKIEDILRLVDATGEVRNKNWNARFAVAQAAALAGLTQDDSNRDPADRAQLEDLHRAALRNTADAGTVTSADLASQSGLSEAKSNAYLELFSLDCSSLDLVAAIRSQLGGASPLRTRPIVVDGTGRAVACHGPLLLEAVRPRLEEALKAAGTDAKYYKHRGDFIEAAAVRLVSDVLPSSATYAGFEYFEPNPNAPTGTDEASRGPRAYTKLVEGDGLILVDDVAIIIESKAVNVSRGTRQGSLGGMRRNLTEVVSKVVKQAHRMRTRIETDGGLRLRDGTWIDLSHVREIHSVAVTLEDLSGIATVTADLVDAGLIDPQSLPWLVSYHDLRIVTELVDRPSELLLFLRRRTHPEVTRTFWAIDELDFFLHFQSTGLYVQPDPDAVAAALPHLPPPSAADRRRYANQTIEFLTSRTGPLDDWYFYQRGVRNTPAAKPSLVASQPLLQLVDAIADSRRPGWASTTVLILECSYQGRADLLARAATVVERVRADGRRHTAPSPLGLSPETLTVLTMASASAPLSAADRAFLESFTVAKKHQAQAAVGATVVFGPDGQVLDLIYRTDTYGPNTELDRLVEDMNLAPLVASRPVPPRQRSRGTKQRRKRR